eukprot:TRINITY_DN1957_c1_g1_i2.p1 TRINITY_DN1957_c1_g1~~TRINITY_DN1957_c1_g1_i2.p1  ORF type:complete len:360 (-),score=82.72 TRINITY_DN1957_c1_g1_i2:124-1203(-)
MISSLTLLADGFHNLSDVVSVFIAWWAIRASKRKASYGMSYGWSRTEIVGSLTNSIFLLSLSLYILLDAIPLFIKPEAEFNNKNGALAFIVVAAAGLVVNFVGTMIFMASGHHHHHGHSHGNHEHDGATLFGCIKMDLNVRAVFLHYMGDSITSIFVLLLGILLYFLEGQDWVNYLDPVASCVMVIFILLTTLPLTKECMIVLLQAAPKSLDQDALQRNILATRGVQGAHALHVWELVDGVYVCTVHVKYAPDDDPNVVVTRVLRTLRRHGVKYATVQPEVTSAARIDLSSPVVRTSSGIPVPPQQAAISHEESQSCVEKNEAMDPGADSAQDRTDTEDQSHGSDSEFGDDDSSEHSDH